MRYKWLNIKNNTKLIIFFNGWGMDEAVVNHLKFIDYDILMFYDYNNLNTDFDFTTIEKYKEKHLVAWSMGVMIATLFPIKYDKKIALNGTLTPIDIKNGIHPKIYDLTIKGFDENGREKFITNMLPEGKRLTINRELEEQRSELIAIKDYKANLDFEYTKVIISNNDKIIPTKSQTSFWGIEPNLDSDHCPFFNFKNWSELL